MIYVVKIVNNETGYFKNLWASFDEDTMIAKAKEMNAKMKEFNYKKCRYDVDTVTVIAEEISEDDF